MPENRRKNEYSYGELRRRGWTNRLIRALLPQPRIAYTARAKCGMRLWKAADVLAAEQSGEFLRGRAAEPGAPAKPDAAAARSALDAAWSPPAGGSDAALLAGHYHAALRSRLAAAAEKPVPEPRARGWLNEFASLERSGDGRRALDVLRRFPRAWVSADGAARERAARRYASALLAVSARLLAEFAAQQPEADIPAFLGAEGFPRAQLLGEGLAAVWSVWYVPRAIRSSLKLLTALNPKDEYPAARAMRRHFVLHIGGTNTGKTYAGLRRLASAPSGVYLAPLRLLALEAQETLLDAGVDCSLTTGEEEDVREGDTHLAATAEKLPLDRRFDVAVIDECQMIADSQRGGAWTRAILGVLAPEVHLCAAPEARGLLIRLIESCGDGWELVEHERSTPLVCMSHPVDFSRVQPGDALITFSKVGVLSVAEDLRQSGKEPAIIYGALPYATRRRQMEGFLNGDMRYVVSTDAIGMGLNLPIRRVIFMETEKFDGTERRELRCEEVKQIAGRAGRRGMYPRGFVGATENLPFIRAALEAVTPPLQYAVTGFSDLVLDVDFDLLEVLSEWDRMPAPEPYRKLDVSRYIAVIGKMRERGFALSKAEELRAANIPFDETEEPLRELFFRLLSERERGEASEMPALAADSPTLPELELYYRKLDLYFSFSKAFGLEIDLDALEERRGEVAEEINEILLHRLRGNIRFCDACGRPLPLHHRGRLCDRCYARRGRRAHGG